MGKIRFLVSLIIATLLSIQISVFASEMPAVIDEAGYLTESELDNLTVRLDEIREYYQVDVAVVIEDVMSGMTAQDTADDIYDYNPYGYNEGNDGILFYVCKEPREYAITTCGYGMTAFNSNGLDYIEDEVIHYLSDDEYYLAFMTYANCCEELLAMASNGKPYNENDGGLTGILFVIIAPLAIAFIMMGMKLSKMNTAVKQSYAENYLKKDSMTLSVSNDIFLYSNIIKTKKVSNDFHKSSSGRSHGGRSGRY